MTTVRVPPGRAGRMRLRRREAAAVRGADLLERKLRALLDEQRVRRLAAQESTRAWADAAAEADRWMARALAAAGRDGLRQCLPAGPAGVGVEEEAAMGVRFPARAAYRPPERGQGAADPGSAALICARDAYERAAEAAVQAAARQAAARAVDAAVDATRRQVRILRRHWIPLLAQTLERLESSLEQADFEDGVRRRHARNVRSGQGRSTLAGPGEPKETD